MANMKWEEKLPSITKGHPQKTTYFQMQEFKHGRREHFQNTKITSHQIIKSL
jgi:cytochrome c553